MRASENEPPVIPGLTEIGSVLRLRDRRGDADEETALKGGRRLRAMGLDVEVVRPLDRDAQVPVGCPSPGHLRRPDRNGALLPRESPCHFIGLR